MIDPKLLTKESGFEDGVVVEYERAGFRPSVTHFGSRVMKMTDIVSIRPLTGPMAIWNFAPKWAQCLVRDEHEFTFLASDEHDEGFETRPWWAK